MSNARPNNLPTRPQTGKIQRDRARQSKNQYAKTTEKLVIRFSRNQLEFERISTRK